MARRHFQWAARLSIAAVCVPLMYFTFRMTVESAMCLVLGGALVALIEYHEIRSRILGTTTQITIFDSLMTLPIAVCLVSSVMEAYCHDKPSKKHWRSLLAFTYVAVMPTWSLIMPNLRLSTPRLKGGKSDTKAVAKGASAQSKSSSAGGRGGGSTEATTPLAARGTGNPRLRALAVDMLFTSVLAAFGNMFIKIRKIDGPNPSRPLGVSMLVFAIMTPWLADAFALFFGGRFGRRRIVPTLSPNKTLEGFIAMIPGAVVSTLGMRWYAQYVAPGFIFNEFHRSQPITFLLLLSVLAACAGAVGDLLESTLKRLANVKDTGTAFGAHGGLLDRLDSVSFSVICLGAILC